MLCSEAVRSPVVFGNSAVGIWDTFGKVAPRFWEVFRKTSEGFLGIPKNFGRKWFLHDLFLRNIATNDFFVVVFAKENAWNVISNHLHH